VDQGNQWHDGRAQVRVAEQWGKEVRKQAKQSDAKGNQQREETQQVLQEDEEVRSRRQWREAIAVDII
jgi:hypothetical protein